MITIKIDLDWQKDILELQSKIYNHKDTPQTVKDFMELQLNYILGREYDIALLLDKFSPKI